jgi:hypothetical protein
MSTVAGSTRKRALVGRKHLANSCRRRTGSTGHTERRLQRRRDHRRQSSRLPARVGSERLACSRHAAIRRVAATARRVRVRVLGGNQRRVLLSVPSRRPPVALGSHKPMDIRLLDAATGHDRAGDAARSVVPRSLLGLAGFGRWHHLPVREGREPRRGSDDDRELPLGSSPEIITAGGCTAVALLDRPSPPTHNPRVPRRSPDRVHP